jgi:hypothetical protein
MIWRQLSPTPAPCVESNSAEGRRRRLYCLTTGSKGDTLKLNFRRLFPRAKRSLPAVGVPIHFGIQLAAFQVRTPDNPRPGVFARVIVASTSCDPKTTLFAASFELRALEPTLDCCFDLPPYFHRTVWHEFRRRWHSRPELAKRRRCVRPSWGLTCLEVFCYCQ